MTEDNIWQDAEQDEVDSENNALLNSPVAPPVITVFTREDRTREEWEAYWNNPESISRNDGKVSYFGSMGDFYQAVKVAAAFEGDDKKDAIRLIHILFDNKEVLTSTTAGYRSKGDGLEVEIAHNPGTDMETRSDWIAVPPGADISLVSILRSEAGLQYVQTIFDTKDSVKTIVDAMYGVFEGKVNAICPLRRDNVGYILCPCSIKIDANEVSIKLGKGREDKFSSVLVSDYEI